MLIHILFIMLVNNIAMHYLMTFQNIEIKQLLKESLQ